MYNDRKKVKEYLQQSWGRWIIKLKHIKVNSAQGMNLEFRTQFDLYITAQNLIVSIVHSPAELIEIACDPEIDSESSSSKNFQRFSGPKGVSSPPKFAGKC